MKLYSSEIRWFSKEKKELFNFYNALPGRSFKEEERTDYYLRTHSTDLGIKIRGEGGRVEIKWLMNKRSLFQLNHETIGITEHWVKTGFNDHDPISDNFNDLSKSQSDWIKINKIRFKKNMK